jgi:carboxylesterase
LWINTGLDVLYIAGGITLASILGPGNPGWLGHGWGIMVQGAFLFFFDLIHAQAVPPGYGRTPILPLHSLRAFSEPLHQPFFHAGGSGAALLVHGFPGTPAEMRPLADVLHDQGWTVQGILLPGFGSQLPEIFERRYTDWLEAVEQNLLALKQKYSPVLLIGYSLGGTLSIAAASRIQPDGLVLLSPFWRIGTPLQRLVGLILRPFLPRYFRPLQRADFHDPKLQQSLADFFPDVDLDDPETHTWLRDLQVPATVISQIVKSGKLGYRRARSVRTPTLVVQGEEDELVRPSNTRRLVERLASAQSDGGYLEIPGGHNIIDKDQPEWGRLEQTLIEFSRSIRDVERILS